MLRNTLTLLLFALPPLLADGQVTSLEQPLVAQMNASPSEAMLVPQVEPLHIASLSLDDLNAMAMENNPTIAAASARLMAARGKQTQAGLYPNPVVGYHGVEIGLRGTAGQQGAFVGQRIITGGKRKLDQAIAGKEIDEAHFQLHAQRQRVSGDVRIRFYDALVTQKRVSLTRELVGIADELVTATEKLIEGRHATENDLLQAEIQADEALILLDNSSNEQEESWRRLVAVVGLPSMQPNLLDGQLDEGLSLLEWDACYATVLGSNPTLRAARKRVERAQLAIKRAKREPIPDIDLFVSNRYHNVTDENVTNVQVGIPVPIFNRNQGNIHSAQAEWFAACNELKRIELLLQDRLAVEFRRYANANQQTGRYRDRMVPRAGRALELVRDGYKKGQVEYLALLTAQRTFLKVNLAYLDALRELRNAASTIESQLLIGSLSEAN